MLSETTRTSANLSPVGYHDADCPPSSRRPAASPMNDSPQKMIEYMRMVNNIEARIGERRPFLEIVGAEDGTARRDVDIDPLGLKRAPHSRLSILR